MPRTSGRGAFLVAGTALALALSLPACGKKAPLRLTDDQTAGQAPAPRARVREGRVTLDFRVPAHRTFPEREDPWVLARILRQAGPAAEAVEAGAILQADGFVFGAPLRWSDQAQPAKSSFIYRVEFRDAARRRRALSDPLTVSWEQVPDAPAHLTAVGHLRSIVLSWAAPIAGRRGDGLPAVPAGTAADGVRTRFPRAPHRTELRRFEDRCRAGLLLRGPGRAQRQGAGGRRSGQSRELLPLGA